MPPATMTLWSPARIIWSAISTARMLEAQTLLIVSLGHLLREPGADGGLAGGRLAGAALEHLAHDHVLDLVVADVHAVERGADRDRAERGRLVVLQGPAELPERRADSRDDD